MTNQGVKSGKGKMRSSHEYDPGVIGEGPAGRSAYHNFAVGFPFISIFLFLVINNPNIVGSQKSNPFLLNILMILVIFVTLVLGLNSALKAIISYLNIGVSGNHYLIFIALVSLIVLIYIWWEARPKMND